MADAASSAAQHGRQQIAEIDRAVAVIVSNLLRRASKSGNEERPQKHVRTQQGSDCHAAEKMRLLVDWDVHVCLVVNHVETRDPQLARSI